MPLTYNPDVFDVQDFEQAKAIILTAERGTTTQSRWKRETPYLADLIAAQIDLAPETTILDYGCGAGRLAKVLIERSGCRVIGVDISASMRALATIHVASDRFFACVPDALDTLVGQGIRVGGAIAVWVLQHCFEAHVDATRLGTAMKPGAPLLVVNNHFSIIPTREAGWVSDGVDIRAILSESFGLREEGGLAAEHVSEAVAGFAFWSTWTARSQPESRRTSS